MLVRRRAHLRGLATGQLGVPPTACGVRWAARWGRSGVMPAGRTPGAGAAREGGRGPVLAPRSRYAPRQNWWRLSGTTFLRSLPCSKLGWGGPGGAAGGRRGARPLWDRCTKVVFTSKTQRTRFQMARDRTAPHRTNRRSLAGVRLCVPRCQRARVPFNRRAAWRPSPPPSWPSCSSWQHGKEPAT